MSFSTSLSRASPHARFRALLAAFLLLLLAVTRADQNGDFAEYGAMAVALAAHGTPAITAADARAMGQLAPDFAPQFDQLARGIEAGLPIPASAFVRGRDGGTYSIHFFAYSALVALPLKLLGALGMAPFKAYQVVNLAFIFLVGLCCLRLFASARRAALGVALFFLCGATLYWNWFSPELVSAASLLSGLILFVTGAPLRAGLLVGLAAMQNPSIVLAAAFAPLLKVAVDHAAGTPWRAAAAALLAPRIVAALALMAAGVVLPALFNAWAFGVPSLLARETTDPQLIGLVRLRAFFFDLNQGMLIGMPGLFVFLAWQAARRAGARQRALLGLCAALVLALAVPTLSTGNFNSGATGLMRYAFWGAMPLLFAALVLLRGAARIAVVPVALLLLVQFASSWEARRYSHVAFSPLAQWVLRVAPGWYDPASEIFGERLLHVERALDPARLYRFPASGVATKTMFYPAQPGVAALLCGAGGALSPRNHVSRIDAGWAYVNGPVLCDTPAPKASASVTILPVSAAP